MKNENYRDKIESALLEAPTYVTSNDYIYVYGCKMQST